MQVFIGIINVLLIINALVLIVSVLMQEGSRQGLGAIAGGAETFFGKTKGKSYEGKLELITKISVTTFILMAIAMTAYNARTGISNVAPVDLTNAPSVSQILDDMKILDSDIDTALPAAEGEAAEVADDAAAADEVVASTEEAATDEAPVATDAEEAAVATDAEEAPVATDAEEAPAATDAEEAPAATDAEEEPAA